MSDTIQYDHTFSQTFYTLLTPSQRKSTDIFILWKHLGGVTTHRLRTTVLSWMCKVQWQAQKTGQFSLLKDSQHRVAVTEHMVSRYLEGESRSIFSPPPTDAKYIRFLLRAMNWRLHWMYTNWHNSYQNNTSKIKRIVHCFVVLTLNGHLHLKYQHSFMKNLYFGIWFVCLLCINF